MTSVAAGSKLVVQGLRMPLILRSLRVVDLETGWSVPVLGDVAAMQAAGLGTGTAMIEFPTELGPVSLIAELVEAEGIFMLRSPGLRTAALLEQRRENVRGVVQLPLRGTLLSSLAAGTRSQAVAEQFGSDDVAVDLHGVTQTVSGGGISADLAGLAGLAGFVAGSKIYVEIGLPGGDLAPAVMTVLEHDGDTVRAEFLDISPLDRERLVRLVFARQRVELAERRSSAESPR